MEPKTALLMRYWHLKQNHASSENLVTLRNQIALGYDDLVKKLALAFPWMTKEIKEDLVQEGMLGLIDAIEHFEPQKGPFLPFAIKAIKRKMERYFWTQCFPIKLPRQIYENYPRIQWAQGALLENNSSVSTKELANFLGLPSRLVFQTLAHLPSNYQFFSFEDRELESYSVEDHSFEEVERRIDLAALLDHLSPKERKIIELVFFHQMQYLRIAKEYQCSRPTIHYLVKQALARLSDFVKTNPDQFF